MLKLPAAVAFLLAAVLASCATRPVFAQEAASAKPAVKSASPAPPREFVLTELQKAKLDAAAQRFWRIQDKANEALQAFGALCLEAQKENKWPAVQCNPTDLSVSAQGQPSAVSSQPSAPK